MKRICPDCGSTDIEHFREALMANIECKGCDKYLMGVGFYFTDNIWNLWDEGFRGYVDYVECREDLIKFERDSTLFYMKCSSEDLKKAKNKLIQLDEE